MAEDKRRESASEKKKRTGENGETKRRNYGDAVVKVVCLCAAFLLWIYVMMVDSPRDEQIIANVPVRLINTDLLERDAKLSVYSGFDNVVDVTVSGKRSVISRLTAEDITATADVSGIQRAAQTSVAVNVTLPADCDLVGLSQNAVSVRVDNYVERDVAIYANLLNKNAAYIYDEMPVFRSNSGSSKNQTTDSYVVDSIMVSGPQSIVETVAQAVVDIDLTNQDSRFTSVLPLYLVDAEQRRIDNEYLDKTLNFVEVTMPIYVTRTLSIPFVMRQGYLNGTHSTVTLSPDTVVVTCDPADADRADLLDTILLDERRSFTSDNINSHLYEADFTLTSPYEVRFSAPQVHLTINIDENIRMREMDIVEIQKRNGVSVDCAVLADSVDNVVICGEKMALAGIRASDLIAVVDLGGYTEANIGERYNKTVSIEIDSESADQVFILGEYTVEIEITGRS